jgi:hypothetical protein
MALKKAITVTGTGLVSGQGMVVNTGPATVTTNPLYIKIEKVSGGKESVRAIVSYSDVDTRDKMTEKTFDFQPKMDGENFVAQAYAHLKSLPEFAGAEDC